MTDAARVDVIGDTELQASLSRVAAELDHLDDAEDRAAQLIRQRAATLAPKVSGALAGSIRADTSGAGVSVSSDLVYAGVQEMGWAGHNIAAQPFMRPALAESTDAVVALYAADVQRLLNTVRGA